MDPKKSARLSTFDSPAVQTKACRLGLSPRSPQHLAGQDEGYGLEGIAQVLRRGLISLVQIAEHFLAACGRKAGADDGLDYRARAGFHRRLRNSSVSASCIRWMATADSRSARSPTAS